MPATASVKPQKGETNRVSLELYKQGRSIDEIAVQRGLTRSTVEGHLATFILTGEVKVGELVPEHKLAPILSAIKEVGESALGPIRSKLGNDYSFGEIRAAMNHLKHLATPTASSSPGWQRPL